MLPFCLGVSSVVASMLIAAARYRKAFGTVGVARHVLLSNAAYVMQPMRAAMISACDELRRW